ncbi:hypothetical protein AAY473_001874 [Plecturocebus cupreus]
MESCFVAQAGVQCRLAHCNLHLQGSSHSPGFKHSPVAGITAMHHHAWLIFVLLVETVFHHIGQAGLELLTSESTHFSLPNSGGWGVQELNVGMAELQRGPSSGLQTVNFSLSSHGGSDKQIPLGLFHKGTNPSQEGFAFMT